MGFLIFFVGFVMGLVVFAIGQDLVSSFSEKEDRPIIVVKVGSAENPATEDDVKKVMEEFQKNCKWNQVVVTHQDVAAQKL